MILLSMRGEHRVRRRSRRHVFVVGAVVAHSYRRGFRLGNVVHIISSERLERVGGFLLVGRFRLLRKNVRLKKVGGRGLAKRRLLPSLFPVGLLEGCFVGGTEVDHLAVDVGRVKVHGFLAGLFLSFVLRVMHTTHLLNPILQPLLHLGQFLRKSLILL